MTEIRPSRIASFARNRARNTAKYKLIYQETFESVKVCKWSEVEKKAPNFQGVNFEIGCGNGETVIGLALKNPEFLFVVSDVYMLGLWKICKFILDNSLKNILIFQGDGRDLMDEMPSRSCLNLYLLFPDPWPKRRHNKRRILNQEFLGLAEKGIVSGGNLWIATDSDDLKQSISQEIFNYQGTLKWVARCSADFTNSPDWWSETRFQKKAIAEGRNAVFLNLKNS